MGLLEQPPHCQVSVSATEGERLLAVTVEDVRRIQLPWGAASLLAAPPAPGAPPGAPPGSGSGSGEAAAQQAPGGSAAEQQQQQDEAAAAGASEDAAASLQLENAKLRAELAAQIALDCIRSAQLAGVSAASVSAAAGSGHASPRLAESGTAAAAAVGGAGPALAAAAALPPDAAQRFERALAAKDGLVAELRAQLAASRQQASAYEGRIQALEAQLTSLAAVADGRAVQPLLAGSGPQAAPEAAAAAAASPAAGTSSGASSGAAGGGAAAEPSSGGGSSVAAASATGTGPLLPEGLAPAAAAAAGSGTSSLSTSPTARQEAPAPDLSASVHAAAGSSLSGALHAADPSRSLGPSSSRPAAQRPASPREPRAGAGAAFGRASAADAERHPAAGEGRLGSSSEQRPVGAAAAGDALAAAVAAPLLGSSLLEGEPSCC